MQVSAGVARRGSVLWNSMRRVGTLIMVEATPGVEDLARADAA